MRTAVVEEVIARGFALALQVGALVEAIERRLDDARILAGLDLLFQSVASRATGDVNEGGQPVQHREDLVVGGARLDVSGPTGHHRDSHAAFPGGQLAAPEWRDPAVRVGDDLGPVVGGEDDDGVVELAHGLELGQHDADVVVQLLHTDFVDAPVLAALRTQHRQVLWREHRGDVHAGRVVPDEEGLVGLLRVIAVKVVNDLGGNFLVDGRRSLEGQRALVLAALVSPPSHPRRCTR